MNSKSMLDRSALVVEGGAMRGIFSVGILDTFLQEGFNPFDLYIGVSAGATNLAAFLAGMPGRNHKVYTDYSRRPQFINLLKFLRGGHLLDVDWLWDITIREMRLDIDQILRFGNSFLVGATAADDGNIRYFTPSDFGIEELIKASSALPVLYRNQVMLAGKAYVDGGLADPIPVQEAWRRGANQIMVLRSRKKGYQMPQKNGSLLYRHFLKDYPAVLNAAVMRPNRYAESIDFMRNPPPGVRVLEVNPPEGFRTSRLTKNLKVLEADYQLGVEAGRDAIAQWKLLCNRDNGGRGVDNG